MILEAKQGKEKQGHIQYCSKVIKLQLVKNNSLKVVYPSSW
jgi:hypothetical protein